MARQRIDQHGVLVGRLMLTTTKRYLEQVGTEDDAGVNAAAAAAFANLLSR
jgi:hypothetical protein